MTGDDGDRGGPGGMDTVDDDPVTGSDAPGGMSGIRDPDSESDDED
jgi:hypothetical protein